MEQKEPGYYVGSGIAIGAGGGVAIGLVLKNISIGIGLGAIIGILIGSIVEERAKRQGKIKELSEKEKRKRNKLSAVSFVVGLIVAVVIATFFISSRRGAESDLVKSEPTNFAKAGVITVNNPGRAQGTMYLVYDEPGAPATSKELVLDALSVCATPNGATPCVAMSITFDAVFAGKRAVIEGTKNNDKVLVRKLRILSEGEDARFAEPGSVFTSWYWATELIKNCEIKSVTQTHALDVYLTLKGGEELRAVEPNIDEVFHILQEANNCNGIPIATE